jgi:hypothetical protein
MSQSLCPAGVVLRDWLQGADITISAFAQLIGTTRMSVWRWMTGECCPSVDYAAAIEHWTGIPARMWASCAELRQGFREAA